jgi:hypothetical protein
LAVGNEFYGTPPDGEHPRHHSFFADAAAESTLAKISRALDDLRRLGETDLRLNHP